MEASHAQNPNSFDPICGVLKNPMVLCIRIIPLVSLLLAAFSPGAFAAGKAHHVVVLVWDGLRPDFVTAELTPTLWGLAREGVTFQNHHPVFLSATEVNGTALATGAYPTHSGIMANREYRPEIDPLKPFGTEVLSAVRRGDALSHGHYLDRFTVAEILQRKGRKTAIAGTKPVALLHDRADRESAALPSPNLYEGQTLPTNLLGRIVQLQGAFPAAEKTKIKRDIWTTQALIGPMWEGEIPAFSLLWLSEPDFSQHETGPGSETSLAAIKGSDDNLAAVLRALEARGVRDRTDIFVVSDHGFSTISRKINVAEALKKAGFNASREFKSPPAKDDVVVSSNGGSVLLYVIGRDSGTIDRIVRFLQSEEYVGVLFTREPVKGAFTLEQAKLQTANPPDIAFALRWTAEKNTNGVPGMVFSDDPNRSAGQGMHVTLSPFDMHNTLIATGPDFRRGIVDPLPTGNTDLAPTILWILGVKPPKAMDGRVLSEALVNEPKGKPPALNRIERIETSRDHERFTWRQYLIYTEVNGVIYFGEGNGFATPK
ncbi:MAG: alkaline phosphatase family protein [Verrucomicrobia bacterium]|nr:alkaline phosphatase family protein [Verrucomicrobiota bacterium]